MDAKTLQNDALMIDSHADSVVAHIRRGNLSLAGGGRLARQMVPGTIAFTRGPEGSAPGASYVQLDFAQMRGAGIDCTFSAVDVTLARGNYLAYALDGIGYLLNDVEASGEQIILVKRADDVRRAKAEAKLAVLLVVENADVTERSLNVLRSLYELGVRSIGLTHNVSSCAADGNGEARPGVGLTRFGVALVQEMNRLGMLVDLAHVSESAFFHALEVTTRPVIFSHGNCRALCDHPRNLTDEQLKALARNGGVIGLSYVPMFVDSVNPTLERLLDHFDHVREVAGVETLGIGGDFDGGGALIPDVLATSRVTEGLLSRGYTEAEVRVILGGNTLRVLDMAVG
ncbi:MAG: dipeptidase [Chloroflexota bacterium]